MAILIQWAVERLRDFFLEVVRKLFTMLSAHPVANLIRGSPLVIRQHRWRGKKKLSWHNGRHLEEKLFYGPPHECGS